MRVLSSLLLLVHSVPLQAVEFLVDRESDAPDAQPGDGACLSLAGGCTLRAAIQESNALQGMDHLRLPEGVFRLSIAGAGEDACASGDLDIRDDLRIEGMGPEHTRIDAGGADRVLDLHGAVPARIVELSALALVGGGSDEFLPWDGGLGLRVGLGVDARLQRVDIAQQQSRNSIGAVALLNFGCLSGRHLRVHDNHGGASWALATILSAGPDSCLRLEDSTISENLGAVAIFADAGAPILLRRSLLAGNQGGPALLLNSANQAVLENSTISGNQGGAALVDGGATLWLQHCTVSGNHGAVVGGIHDVHGGFGRTTAVNSVIAGNTGALFGSDDCSNMRSLGGTVIGSLRRCQALLAPGDRHDIDAGLGPLDWNGGATRSHWPGSVLIDQALAQDCPDTDQRGEPRPRDGDGNGQPRCDIGAVEIETALLRNGFEADQAAHLGDGPLESGRKRVPAPDRRPGLPGARVEPVSNPSGRDRVDLGQRSPSRDR